MDLATCLANDAEPTSASHTNREKRRSYRPKKKSLYSLMKIKKKNPQKNPKIRPFRQIQKIFKNPIGNNSPNP